MTIQAALNVNSYPKGIKISQWEWNYSILRRMTSALKIALLHVIRVRMPPPADGCRISELVTFVSEYVTQNVAIVDIECAVRCSAAWGDESEAVPLRDPIMPVANGLYG